MAATKGNKFWEARSKHGRNSIFENAESMREAANEYFKWNNENPWYRIQLAFDKQIKIPVERPMTIEGLTTFWGVNVQYLNEFEKSQTGQQKDFSAVTAYIRQVIRQQKFEGAVVGAYNPTIISRDLGLVDKSESKNINFNTDASKMTKEEIRHIAESLEDEY